MATGVLSPSPNNFPFINRSHSANRTGSASPKHVETSSPAATEPPSHPTASNPPNDDPPSPPGEPPASPPPPKYTPRNSHAPQPLPLQDRQHAQQDLSQAGSALYQSSGQGGGYKVGDPVPIPGYPDGTFVLGGWAGDQVSRPPLARSHSISASPWAANLPLELLSHAVYERLSHNNPSSRFVPLDSLGL